MPLAVSVGTVSGLPPAWLMVLPLTRSSSENPPPPPVELMSSGVPNDPTVSAPAVAEPSWSRSATTLSSSLRVTDRAPAVLAPLASSTGRPALNGWITTAPRGA